MTASGRKTAKSPTQKRHLADVKYFAPLQILCGGADIINKYLSDTEYLLYFRKGKGKLFPENYEDAKTYYLSPINTKDKKMWKHPTIKPISVTEKIIRNSSKENFTILDPFMGSGTTGVACINTNRDFIGVELDEKYYKIAEERINSAIKQTA